MSYANGTPNYDLPQTITTDKRDWADTNIPFLKLDSDLHYTKELAESFDERITQCEDDIDAHGVRLTELEKYVEDDPDGYAKYEYEEGNLFLIDGRVCVATTEIHEGHTLVEGVNYEVYIGSDIKFYTGDIIYYPSTEKLVRVTSDIYAGDRISGDNTTSIYDTIKVDSSSFGTSSVNADIIPTLDHNPWYLLGNDRKVGLINVIFTVSCGSTTGGSDIFKHTLKAARILEANSIGFIIIGNDNIITNDGYMCNLNYNYVSNTSDILTTQTLTPTWYDFSDLTTAISRTGLYWSINEEYTMLIKINGSVL